MRLQDLFEAYTEQLNLQSHIDEIEKYQEEINSMSIGLGNEQPQNPSNQEKIKKIEHEYRALEAIRMVLLNNQKKNQNLQQDSTHIFTYDVERDKILAAIWAKVSGDLVEVKWLGSLQKGRGKPLLFRVLQKAKQMGARKVQLTSKWESEGFYQKLGFKPRTLSRMNIVGDMYGEYERDL